MPNDQTPEALSHPLSMPPIVFYNHRPKNYVYYLQLMKKCKFLNRYALMKILSKSTEVKILKEPQAINLRTVNGFNNSGLQTALGL